MALDTRIPLGVQPPQIQPPMEAYAQVLNLQRVQQQIADDGVQRTEHQEDRATVKRRMQRESDIQKAASDAYAAIQGGDAESVLSQLRPEVRTVAEGWLKDFSAAKSARDAEGAAQAKKAAQMIQALGYDPMVAATSIKLLSDVYPEAKPLLEHVEDPAKLKAIVDHFANFGEQPKQPEPFTLGDGQTRFDPTGKPIASVAPKPPTPPAGFNLSPGQTRFGPDGKPVASLPPTPTGGRSPAAQKEIDDLVDTVIGNPALFDRLTPTVQGQIAPALNAKGFSEFGKPLSDAAMKSIAESQSAIDSLKDLRGVLAKNEQYIGPIAGLSAMNPYSGARKAQANIDLVRQRVGKALEGGVLRKEDEEKYKIILATLRDTPETAIYKVDQLIKSIENNVDTFKATQRLGGRRLSTGDAGAGPKEGETKPIDGYPGTEQTYRGGKWIRTK